MVNLTEKQQKEYNRLLNEFECKAKDIVGKLTKEYEDTLAEEIDYKINNFKEECERLKKENAELKARVANAIEPKFKIGQEVWYPSIYKNDYCLPIYCNKISGIEVGINGKNELVLKYVVAHKINNDLYKMVKSLAICETKEQAEAMLKTNK